jgi:hypothetical protein
MVESLEVVDEGELEEVSATRTGQSDDVADRKRRELPCDVEKLFVCVYSVLRQGVLVSVNLEACEREGKSGGK